MKNPISSIIFDLGGVILNLDYHRTISAFQMLTSLNVQEVYTQANQVDVFDDFETGAIDAKTFREKLSSLLEIQVSDAEFDNAWNAMLLNLPEARIKLLEKLSKDYRIFLFSNTNVIHYKAFQEEIERKFGEKNLFERIFEKTYYSHLHNERKPNAIAFQKILNEQSLDPYRTLFIDDSVQHIEGAGKLGIQTIHLDNMDILDACKHLVK